MENIKNTRKCCKCKIEKDLTEFCRDKYDPTGRTYSCKKCRSIIYKQWVKDNPEKYLKSREDNKEYRREYYQSPERKLKHRKRFIEKKYKIPYSEYEEMVKKQNNLCAICDKSEPQERNSHLAVDHCHKTGKIRELLCSRCNLTIGLLEENTEILKKIIEYIKKHAN